MKKFRKLFSSNNNSNNNLKSKGFKKILDKEGFYIIMFLCVCILGTTAVWVAKSNVDRLAEDEIRSNEEIAIDDSNLYDIGEKEIEDQAAEIIVINEDEEAETSTNEDAVVTTEEENKIEEKQEEPTTKKGKQLVESPEPTPELEVAEISMDEKEDPVKIIETSTPEHVLMQWPVKGDLGMGYAVETLTYSKTLEHFTTHHGIDIMAEENTPVKAAMAGEIIEVLTDSRLGITISIEHEDGLITRYSNLCTDKMIKLGDKVTDGQTISGVGTSSVFESAEEPHLHFEVLKDGTNVDPLEYMAFE